MSEWLDDYADRMEVSLYCMEPRSVYDSAVVGVVNEQVVYDRNMVISILMRDMEMDEAEEFHYTNQDSMGLFGFLDRPASIFDDEQMGGIPLDDIESSLNVMLGISPAVDAVQALSKLESKAIDVDTSLN